ncbi:MAG TPA: aminotransferase class I/II-fold pyridoxal phosphate-dependent enzyme [Woeseiaceae bacterium]
MKEERRVDPETLAAQGTQASEADGSVVPPLTPSTTFARDTHYALLSGSRSYARDHNPTFEPAEHLLAHLEHGKAARLFASGMAAATAVVQTLAPGERIVAPRVMYWGLRNWLLRFSAQWGIDVALFDAADPDALARAVAQGNNTRLVWIETPCNPTWDVIDIARAADVAHARGAKLAVDSTVATPVHTRPLELGADLVMHSATKYLNGHADVVAGALVTAHEDDWWQRICEQRAEAGAIPGTFEAWLLQRGMRTLFVRVAAASASALAIARRFEDHPRIERVLYPGLASHPGHGVAARQMHGGYGGMLSLRVKGGPEAALAVANACRVFIRATSLGGTESLIEHRYTIEGPESPIPPDLLRLSIGIESTRDLIADLEQALERA